MVYVLITSKAQILFRNLGGPLSLLSYNQFQVPDIKQCYVSNRQDSGGSYA